MELVRAQSGYSEHDDLAVVSAQVLEHLATLVARPEWGLPTDCRRLHDAARR